MVYRVYVEKKPGQTHEADSLFRQIREFLQIKSLSGVRVLNRYDVENITEELGVGVICKHFHISKSMLYREFHARFGCTVGEYITSKRIEAAEKLLRTTQLSVSEISEKCGIDNYQYFCRLFKKSRGLTPLQYRKNNS
jgi:AraC-like DNA-binding protein